MALAEPAATPDADEASRLFIGGIPFGMTEAEVRRLFDGIALPHEVSPIVEVTLITARNGAPRGFGFVQLATVVQAERARALLDGRAVSYGGRMPTRLVVRAATRPAAGQPRATPIANRVLWVGNLSWAQRPVPLRDAFAAAADVEPGCVYAHLPRDSSTRRTMGFALVRFPDPPSAARALAAMRGTELSGRQLLVRLDLKTNSAVGGDTMDEVGGKAAGIGASRQPAADAIDPELLAEVEVQLVDQELETRREAAESRRMLGPIPSHGA